MKALVALKPLLAIMVIVSVLALIIGSFGNIVLVSVLTAALVNLVLVVGVYVFNGNSGIFSFGQMVFMMIGAYTAALFSIPSVLKATLLPDLPSWIQETQFGLVGSILVGGVLAAVVAVVVGFPITRLSGIQAGIASLALLLIGQNVASRWTSVTNGSNTLVGIPTDLTVFSASVIVLIVIALAFFYQKSTFGLRIRAAREDELAATAAGVKVGRERLLAFVLSGFICGIGGGMSAHYLGALNSSIESFFTPTFLVIAMLVIGGLYSLFGAVVGTVFVSVVVELLRLFQQGVQLGSTIIALPVGTDTAVLGVLLLLMLILRPAGITSGRELDFRLTARERRSRREPLVGRL